MVAVMAAAAAPPVAVAAAGLRPRRRGEPAPLARLRVYRQARLTRRTRSSASFAWPWGRRPKRLLARPTLILLSLRECHRETRPPRCGCRKRHRWTWSLAACTCLARAGRRRGEATRALASAGCHWAAWRRRRRQQTCQFGRRSFLGLASRGVEPAAAPPAEPWGRQQRRLPLRVGRGGSRHRRRRPLPPLPPPRRRAKSVSGPMRTIHMSQHRHLCRHRPPSPHRRASLRLAASGRLLLYLPGCPWPALGLAAAAPRQGVDARTSASRR